LKKITTQNQHDWSKTNFITDIHNCIISPNDLEASRKQRRQSRQAVTITKLRKLNDWLYYGLHKWLVRQVDQKFAVALQFTFSLRDTYSRRQKAFKSGAMTDDWEHYVIHVLPHNTFHKCRKVQSFDDELIQECTPKIHSYVLILRQSRRNSATRRWSSALESSVLSILVVKRTDTLNWNLVVLVKYFTSQSKCSNTASNFNKTLLVWILQRMSTWIVAEALCQKWYHLTSVDTWFVSFHYHIHSFAKKSIAEPFNIFCASYASRLSEKRPIAYPLLQRPSEK
jgi:hypothetical protein